MPSATRLVVAVAALALSAGCDDTPPTRVVHTSSTAVPDSGAAPVPAPDTDPYDVVRNVYRGVAGQAPEEVCARFTPEAAGQFAGHFQAESCTTVVVLLYHGLVADPEAYADTSLGYFTANEGDTRVEIDSCEFDVRGGPRLGVFTLSRDGSGAWTITAHRMVRCDR